MNDTLRYSLVIEWSDEDDAFLVTLPEWEGRVFTLVTHGGDAVKHGHEALQALVSSTRKHGESLPPLRVLAAHGA